MNRPQFQFGSFVQELRSRRGSIPKDLYDDLVASLEVGLSGRTEVPANSSEPDWMAEARSHMGTKEIPGSRHNAKILGWIKALGGWFKDDETPWCGTFVAACMQAVDIAVPEHWYRARAWASWGVEVSPRVGAVVVFARRGGGHVGFLVGESDANFYVLGGNQSNMVNIAPIAKSRMIAVRWPIGEPLQDVRLARMSGGAISRNEA